MNEFFKIAWPDIISFLFVFVRVGVLFGILPFFSAEIVPRKVTAILAFFMSLVLMPVVPPASIGMEDINVLMLVVLIIHEMMIGICLALSINVILAGIQIAGQLAGFQMGFAIANVVDPITGANAPITANLLYMVSFLLFFAFGGHHLLIKAMVESYYLIPVTDSFPQQGFLFAAISYAANMFIIAIKVASPMIGVLLLINVSFAIIARSIPQMNIFIMAFPLTISVGLFFIILVIKIMPYIMRNDLQQAWGFMKSVMALY